MDKVEKLLMDYLMECLKIHHQNVDRKFKTILEARKEFKLELYQLIKGALPKEREEAFSHSITKCDCTKCLRNSVYNSALNNTQQALDKVFGRGK